MEKNSKEIRLNTISYLADSEFCNKIESVFLRAIGGNKFEMKIIFIKGENTIKRTEKDENKIH
jgi:hypothetical protein